MWSVLVNNISKDGMLNVKLHIITAFLAEMLMLQLSTRHAFFETIYITVTPSKYEIRSPSYSRKQQIQLCSSW